MVFQLHFKLNTCNNIALSSILFAAPEVETFRALRVNSTAFNFTLQVTYTGGGDIVEFAVRLRENGQSTFIPLDTLVPEQSQSNPRVWYAVLIDERFAQLVDPEFQVITSNFRGQSTSEPVRGEDGKNQCKYIQCCVL